MASVFVSYRRQDVPEHVERLRRRLEKEFGRSEIFTDVADIKLGDDFLAQIRESLKKRDVILVVIGPRWTRLLHERLRAEKDPDYVGSEVAAALKLGMTVVPVFVAGAQMPSRKHLPKAIRPLANRNGLVLSDATWKRDVANLCRYLRTAEYRSSEIRGYVPRRLILPSVLHASLAWGLTSVALILVALALFNAKKINDASPWYALAGLFFIAGALCGAWVGVAHWFLLRKTRIVIKRGTWRSLVRRWSIVTAAILLAGYLVVVHREKGDDTVVLQAAGVVFLAVGVAGALTGFRETRKLRKTDDEIGCRNALVTCFVWTVGGLVGLIGGVVIWAILRF